MARYLALKIGRALFVVWAAFTLTFVLLYVAPADPVDLLFDPAEVNSISPQTRAATAAIYGFDQPVPVQYLQRLGAASTGDFGTSVQSRRPVVATILDVLPGTLLLAAGALLLALVLAFGVAVLATSTRSPRLRDLIEAIPPAAVSVPVFLIGIVLVQVFAFGLGWFPAFGAQGPSSVVLPLVTLSIPISGPIAQLLVRSFTAELDRPYVLTAAAKGGTRAWTLRHEVFRNAALPALTLAGVTFGTIVANAVIVETVFSRVGIGRLTQSALNTLDVPLVQGIVVLVSATFALINLLVDLAYPLLDPRLGDELRAPAPAERSAA